MTPSHLKSLQAIELALRFGSLRQAADALSITPAAVGQRIKAIEDYLGLELVVRGRSGLQPTPALSDALEHLRAAFRELEQFGDLLEVQKGDEIHVAAPSDFVELWLAPRLHRFRNSHPRVRFCINGEGDAPYRVGRVDCSVSFGFVETNGWTMLFRDFLCRSALQESRPASRGSRRASDWKGFRFSISISTRTIPLPSDGPNGLPRTNSNARPRTEGSGSVAWRTVSTR